MIFLQHFCFEGEKLLQFLFLFPHPLSRPSLGQHRRDGVKTERRQAGLCPPRGQAPERVGPVATVLSPLSSHFSPSSSCISLPPNFLYKAHSLPSVLDPNEAIFSDTISESINDQEELMSSVWKLSDLPSLLSLFSLILTFKGEGCGMFLFYFVSHWFPILSTLYYYSHVFLSYGFAYEDTFSHDYFSEYILVLKYSIRYSFVFIPNWKHPSFVF